MFCTPVRLRRMRQIVNAATNRAITPTATPTPIPALAPVERPPPELDELLVGDAVLGASAEACVPDPVLDAEVDVGLGLDPVVDEVVADDVEEVGLDVDDGFEDPGEAAVVLLAWLDDVVCVKVTPMAARAVGVPEGTAA